MKILEILDEMWQGIVSAKEREYLTGRHGIRLPLKILIHPDCFKELLKDSMIVRQNVGVKNREEIQIHGLPVIETLSIEQWEIVKVEAASHHARM